MKIDTCQWLRTKDNGKKKDETATSHDIEYAYQPTVRGFYVEGRPGNVYTLKQPKFSIDNTRGSTRSITWRTWTTLF
jgi:hypothetical protein